jgi:hypothetical protein
LQVWTVKLHPRRRHLDNIDQRIVPGTIVKGQGNARAGTGGISRLAVEIERVGMRCAVIGGLAMMLIIEINYYQST